MYGSTDDVSDGDGGSWQEAALRAMSGRDASTSYGGSQSGDAGSGWGVFAAGSGGGGPQAGAGPKGPPRRVGPKRVQRRITVNPRGPGTAAAPAPLEGGGGGPVFIDIALTGTKVRAAALGALVVVVMAWVLVARAGWGPGARTIAVSGRTAGTCLRRV